MATVRRAISVRGIVQGVGFRPFVYRKAIELGLRGWVRNVDGAVEIEAQGDPAALEEFQASLQAEPPSPARVLSIQSREIPRCEADAFLILGSESIAAPRPSVPADLATCRECHEETRTPGARRFAYPFTNCTRCGPRYSIIERTPYDRPRTSMKGFPLCSDCAAEYADPADRRFHAQPIACPRCGPRLALLDSSGTELASGEEALRRAVAVLDQGLILALKGLGGFQLLADATDDAAVLRLRERKRREAKPFAVMEQSLHAAMRHCEVSEDEARALASPEAPILLLRKRAADAPEVDPNAPRPVSRAVAPGNPRLGIMLPYTPLHQALLDAHQRPLVCTSGNISDEPMCIETAEVFERLGGVFDMILTHNRPIVRPVDDSVVRIDAEGRHLLRRARGFAPLPIGLPAGGPTVLALGAHLKSTVALALDDEVVVSQHLGDMDGAEARALLERTVLDLTGFFGAVPEIVACDMHPDYASTHLAGRLASQWGAALVRVQHHHAHVASCLLERRLSGTVLGLAWDGTGHGADGLVWGGEALLSNASAFRRIAHLRPFPLPGGEQAIREPRRAALGLIYEVFGDRGCDLLGGRFRTDELPPLVRMLQRSVNSPRTTSVGRLFDAVAALAGLRDRVAFEGQAATELEYALDGTGEEPAYPLPLRAGDPAVGDWEPLVRAVLSDLSSGVPPGRVSARFHNALVDFGVACARLAGCGKVVMSGGCFQNAVLTERLLRRLRSEGFDAYTHRDLPPNDGGIAAGQVLVARARWRELHDVPRRAG